MRGSQYVPIYYGDFLRGTQGWTFPERSVYLHLLCAQWEMGALPEDPARLATIVGADLATINSVWLVVGPKFTRTRAGLVNRRMDQHRKNHIAYRRRQSEGGKKGMASRYAKASNVVPFPGKEQPRG